MNLTPEQERTLLKSIRNSSWFFLAASFCLLLVILIFLNNSITGSLSNLDPDKSQNANAEKQASWVPPEISSLGNSSKDQLIKYGKELISNTAWYIGPRGKVMQTSNGMNCQNCHLEAGTKRFGNNYGAVASTYPKFRDRSGSIESIYKRVNDCIERSLNGKALDTSNKEMQAIQAYILWLGESVEKGKKPPGSGLAELSFLDRAADPVKGKKVYLEKCRSCHQTNGEGQLRENGIAYEYPPLWGKNSYTIGAGLYRLSRFASYVKSNMPLGANHENPQLSDEEAWDVAAYVNSQERPFKNIRTDWPNIASKPVDHPFGPFADKFTERQHKYGPFAEIAEYRKHTQEFLNRK